MSVYGRVVAGAVTFGVMAVTGVGAADAHRQPKPRPTTTTSTTSTVTPSATPTSTTSTVSPLGYPGASSTGVPAGTALTPSGSITVSTPGTVLDALDVRGTITINASNVTLKRSRVAGSAYAIIRVADTATNVAIQDVEINGLGTAGTGNSGGVIGPANVTRANIYGVENGVVPDSGSVLQDSYIHDLAAPGAPHYDGVQIDGGLANITLRHNTVDLRGLSQTSAVMIDNYFGPTSNVVVDGNRLLGAGYVVYSDGQFSGGSITGVSFTNNRMGYGYWGYGLVRNNTVTWTGNVDDATGATISYP